MALLCRQVSANSHGASISPCMGEGAGQLNPQHLLSQHVYKYIIQYTYIRYRVSIQYVIYRYEKLNRATHQLQSLFS